MDIVELSLALNRAEKSAVNVPDVILMDEKSGQIFDIEGVTMGLNDDIVMVTFRTG